MDLHTKIFLFNLYSYFQNILQIFLEIMPQPIRYYIFKLMFRRLGKNCMLDYKTYFRYPWRISIGDNSCINRGCEMYASFVAGNAEITIGKGVALGPHVKIFSASHDYSTIDLKDIAGSVSIGDDVWVGGGAIILPGVTIGNGVVIGAGAVVTRDIPPYSIATGNPARVIKKREINNEHPTQ